VYTAVLHLLHSSFKWGSSGCYNGSRYKKRLKTTCFKKQWLKWTKQAHQRHTNYGSKWVGNSRKRPRPNFRHAVKDFCCSMDAMEIRTGKRSLFRSPCQTRQLSRRPCQQEPTLRPRGSTPWWPGAVARRRSGPQRTPPGPWWTRRDVQSSQRTSGTVTWQCPGPRKQERWCLLWSGWSSKSVRKTHIRLKTIWNKRYF